MIQQLDLYALHGFNKNAKRTSLKWCEFGMGFENVEDVDFNELLNPLSSEQERKVLIYNINDVLATHELYKRSEDLIKIRKELSKTYNINLMNADEPKLTTELFLELLHRESGINKNIIKEGRSPKEKILLKDVILPYIKFETYALKETLKMFKSKVIPGNSLKGVLEYNTNVFDIQVYYGLGGIHACTESGVYRSTDDKIIIDCDVK